MDRIKLTGEHEPLITTCSGRDGVFIETFNIEHSKRLKQQILEDQEKAEKWDKLDNYVKEQTPEEICRVFWEFSYECDGGAMQQMETDKLEQENKQLKEEIIYLKELNNGLDYCAEQESIKSKNLKQRLEKIQKFNKSHLSSPLYNKLKEILDSK